MPEVGLENLALVRADGAARTYRRGRTPVPALAAATCALFPGDRVALMGPSGSGKSTLIHLLGGLDTPTSGTVTWPALGPRETLRPAKVGLVFQAQSLLPSLNVVENVELPLLLRGTPPAEARDSARASLERFELGDLSEKLPEELSGGQAQRVALARALAAGPPLLLADEPTGQLDHGTAGRLLDALLEALEGTGTALAVATHDPAVAERLAKRWHIDHGVLEVAP